MKDSTKFTRWLDRVRDTMPPDILFLATAAQCALNQMDMDPRSNELEPRLKAMNLADINAFAVAYDAHKSRVVPT